MARESLVLVTLFASATGLVLARRRVDPPVGLCPPLVGIGVLAAFQLVPLPCALHRQIAPGSASVWYPSVPQAAAILGAGPHPISLDPGATVHWLAWGAGLASLTLLAAPALRQRVVALRAALATVFGALAVAGYALVARLTFGDKLFGILAVPTVAPFGPFVSKNHFAGYIEMAACLSVGLAAGLADEARRAPDGLSWLESARPGRVVLAWGAAAVLVLTVPVSLSRGGVVSLTAGLLVFAVLRVALRPVGAGRRRFLAIALAMLAVTAAGVVSVLPPEATDRVRTLAGIRSEGSGSYRLAIWHDSLRLAASSPLLGSGFGAYQDAIPRFKSVAGDLTVEHAESDYVELLAEGGLVGSCLLGFLLLVGLKRALANVREEAHRLTRGLRCGALAGVAALLVHSSVDFNLHIPSNALLFALLCAFVLAPVEPPSEAAPGQSRARLGALTALLLCVAAAAVWAPRTGRQLDRSLFARAPLGGRGLRAQGLAGDAISHLRWHPADATAWVALGWLRNWRTPAEAGALARWGVGLDPQYEALRRVAAAYAELPQDVRDAPQTQPRKPE